MPPLNCPDPVLRQHAQGIARVAVDDQQMRLVVTYEVPLTAAEQRYALNPRSYSLTGGQRIFPRVLQAARYTPPGTPPDLRDRRVALTLDQIGDFSIYTLSVNGDDIDPFFASHSLRFRLACDEPFDCRETPPPPPSEPELAVVIDYLTKDYSSFRQALLDFIPTRMPQWTERSEADMGMMLLELFAATADTLSYVQDRVANEAFLSSASQRRSVAGHLALLGYQIDEGASASTWLQFQVNDTVPLPNNPGLRVSTDAQLLESDPRFANEQVIVFETLGEWTLRPEHNKMAVYDWGNAHCCLPRNSTSAALFNPTQASAVYDRLQAGDYLFFEDGLGHRDVVRLVDRPQIVPADPIKARKEGPLTVVRWAAATPLHYDYCAPSTFARGNVVPATHGETVSDEPLRNLSQKERDDLLAEIRARKIGQRIPRQRLRLAQAPLAHLDASTMALGQRPTSPATTPTPAANPFTSTAPRSFSTLSLEVEGYTAAWQERPTLLESRGDEQVYRVEIDDSGDATVVFGDDTFGLRPDETADIYATYRVGGGKVGNVAADSLTLPRPRATESLPWLVSVTNPLPATGGRDLESSDHARRFGPATFKKPLEAVTVADYQATARGYRDQAGQQPVKRANAAFRWTGSWLTATLAIDLQSSAHLDAGLRQRLLAYLDTRRLAGYDVEVTRAVYLPIEVSVEFCALAGFRPADVQQALEQALGAGDLPNGEKGFFHADNFTFGWSVSISKLYAAIMAVPGVESARITRLAKLRSVHAHADTVTNLRQGYLKIGDDQIVQLDNDRNFPERGVLTVRPMGGDA